MKNFHIYNNFFKTVININVIMLYIISAKYNNISKYKKWLSNSN